MTTLTINNTEPLSLPSPVPQMEPLRLELLGSSERSAAINLWRQIESSLSNRRLMCSSIWTDTWLNHYGALVPHQFVIAKRGQTACGMALLTKGVAQHAGPFAVRTWHVGTAGEPDADSVCIEYNSLLVCDEDRNAFSRLLVA